MNNKKVSAASSPAVLPSVGRREPERSEGHRSSTDGKTGAYRQTPRTAGTIRRPDRLLAAELYARSVPLCAVENAFVLAASRRLIRPVGAAPLTTIRSLAYFSPVIEEVLESRVSPNYYQYLRNKIQRFLQTSNAC